MANQKILDQKQEIINEIADKVKNSNSVVFFEYQGLTVSELSELRNKLKPTDAEVKVYKNTLMNLALKDKNIKLDDFMEGPNAYLFSSDVIEPINIKNDYYALIVKPEQGCSTKEVYAMCDKQKNWPHGNVDLVVRALEEGNDDLLADSIFNVLEASSIKMVPAIQTIKDELKELGFTIAMMTGSGSAVFALSTDKKLIKLGAKKLEDKYNVIITKVIK